MLRKFSRSDWKRFRYSLGRYVGLTRDTRGNVLEEEQWCLGPITQRYHDKSAHVPGRVAHLKDRREKRSCANLNHCWCEHPVPRYGNHAFALKTLGNTNLTGLAPKIRCGHNFRLVRRGSLAGVLEAKAGGRRSCERTARRPGPCWRRLTADG